MRLKLDWASLIVGSKFTIFALFYFVLEDNFPQVQAPGELIFGGVILRRVFALPVWRAYIHGGAYFRNFTVLHLKKAFETINHSILLQKL